MQCQCLLLMVYRRRSVPGRARGLGGTCVTFATSQKSPEIHIDAKRVHSVAESRNYAHAHACHSKHLGIPPHMRYPSIIRIVRSVTVSSRICFKSHIESAITHYHTQRFGSSQDDVGYASRCKKEAIGSQERDVETAEAAKTGEKEGPMPSFTRRTTSRMHACREKGTKYTAHDIRIDLSPGGSCGMAHLCCFVPA